MCANSRGGEGVKQFTSPVSLHEYAGQLSLFCLHLPAKRITLALRTPTHLMDYSCVNLGKKLVISLQFLC
jgi:hypothetical protein